jgi:hypothetical protein
MLVLLLRSKKSLRWLAKTMGKKGRFLRSDFSGQQSHRLALPHQPIPAETKCLACNDREWGVEGAEFRDLKFKVQLHPPVQIQGLKQTSL